MSARGSKIKFLLLLLGILFLITIISDNVHAKNISLGVIEEKNDIKNIEYWNLTNKIFIDDTIPSMNWNKTATENPWCTGFGTSSDPYRISGVKIDANNIGSCIFIKHSNVYFTIDSCTVYNSQDSDLDNAGIRLEATTNGVILNCIIRDNQGDGIVLDGCHDIKIQGCNIYNNRFGITQIWSTHTITIVKNSFRYNERGVFMSANGRNDTIVENVFVDNSDGNLYLNPGSFNVIQNNKITGGFRGIHLWGDNNSISFNDISSCYSGILLINGWNTGDNVITINSIHDNYDGIMIEGTNCRDNLIYNNSLTNNGLNAHDDGLSNDWNNAVIGNNWGDYVGVDANDDGIGDSPYIINGLANSRDFKPILWDAPKIDVIYPLQDAVFETAPHFEIAIAEGIVNSSWYTINNGPKHLISANLAGTIDEMGWSILPNGTVTIYFYANDSKNYISCKPVTIHKDVLAPIITILFPKMNYGFGFNAPNYYLFIVESRLDSYWYSFDDGVTIFSLHSFSGVLDQATWESLDNGIVTITFWAQDSLGHVSFIDVNIVKFRSVPIIPGPNSILIVLMMFPSIVYVIWRIKKKLG